MSILSKIIRSIKDNSSCRAFCINNKYFTYKEFANEIVKIQKAIQENVTDNEKNIGLITNNDIQTYAAIFAIWIEGKAYVPLNPKIPESRNVNIIEQSEILTIIDSSHKTRYNQFNIIHSKNLNKVNTVLKFSSYSPDNLAYIFFTSGTTGNPKGVQITHHNLNSFMEAFWQLNYTITNNDRCLQMFDLTFDLSVVSFLAPLVKGACIFTVSNENIKYLEVLKTISNYNLTFTLMVPSILHSLRPFFKKINCSSIKYSMFCGEALHLDITEAWSKCVPNAIISNVYGPTECTIYCTNYIYKREGENKSYNGILSIGKSMDKTHILIVDKNNNLLQNNEEGELCLSGPQLTKGYWRNKTINKKAFFNLNKDKSTIRYYKTGDLGRIDENEDIIYLGRIDFQAKVQGYRIELSEIEFHVKKIISNINLVALIIKNELNNTEVALAIETKKFDTRPLKEKLRHLLPEYMIPNKIEFYNKLPLNVNGKINRKEIIKKMEKING